MAQAQAQAQTQAIGMTQVKKNIRRKTKHKQIHPNLSHVGGLFRREVIWIHDVSLAKHNQVW